MELSWYLRNKDNPEFMLRREARRVSHPENLILNTARYRAKRDGLEFDLELSDIVIPSHCPVLDIPIFRSKTGRVSNNSPSLDRVDNSKGYTKRNVRVISNKANAMKRDHSLESLEKMVRYIKEHTIADPR